MKYLFLTHCYPSDLFESYLSNTIAALDFASNNLNRAIIQGLQENGVCFDVINEPIVGSYPLYYRKLWVEGYKKDNFVSIPYFNLIYLKRFHIYLTLLHYIGIWCKKNKGEKAIVLYTIDHYNLIKRIKRKYPCVKVYCIVADLPEFMATDNGVVTRLNKLMGGDKSVKGNGLNAIDGFILLAPAMKERLPIGNKPWIQMEGIYNPETSATQDIRKEDNKTILYSGDLGKRYGILDLLDAFSGIEGNNYQLMICGNGDSRDEIIKRSVKDTRIKYLGMLPRNEVLNLQKSSTLLVNPRHSKDEYTRYSFPSKTLEYMASGTPTLMAHLDSIPTEYDNYLYYLEDETVEGLRNKIVEICNKPKEELASMGSKAAEFILNNKMPRSQVKKIIDFISIS